MAYNTDIQRLLYRARLLLEEGQSDTAFAIFSTMQAEDASLRNHLIYLYGWYYAQTHQWKEGLATLSSLLQSGELIEPLPQVERELQAIHLLYLGIAAAHLHLDDEAIDHLTRCLKLLHDRRIHLPRVRIEAHARLGTLHQRNSNTTFAMQHFEEALRLSRHYRDEQALPIIYRGLCQLHRSNAAWQQAYHYGKEALHRYEQRADRPMEADLHLLLAHICQHNAQAQEAIAQAQTALDLANELCDETLSMRACIALAELHLSTGDVEAARLNCERALATIGDHISPALRALACYTAGKISYMEAQQAQGEQRTRLLEEANTHFAQADQQLTSAQTEVHETHLTDLYTLWGSVLEALGRPQEALHCWRSGYRLLSGYV